MNIKLKNKRESKSLTQKSIAEKAKISLMSYQRYESGERSPNVDTAKLIAKVLNCKIEDIF